MINRIAHQVTAFGLAAVFTLGILGSIDLLAVQPVETDVLSAESAASQVVRAGARSASGG